MSTNRTISAFTALLIFISLTVLFNALRAENRHKQSESSFNKACSVIADQDKALKSVDVSGLSGVSKTIDRGQSGYEKAGCDER